METSSNTKLLSVFNENYKIIVNIIRYVGIFLFMLLLYLISIAFNQESGNEDSLIGMDIEESLIEHHDDEIVNITSNNKIYVVKDNNSESGVSVSTGMSDSTEEKSVATLNDTTEEKIIDPLQVQLLNYEAFIKNSNIDVLDLDPNTIKPGELVLIKKLIEDINTTENKDSVTTPLSARSDTSSEFERLVKEIRSGSIVTILTISDTEDDESLSPTYPPSWVHGVSCVPSDDAVREANVEELNPTKGKGRQIVFITKPVLEGENPLPLPSWFHVPKQPESDQELEMWKKDNIARKYWTSKYPFLDLHYQESSFSLGTKDCLTQETKDLKENQATYHKTDNVEEQYVGLESLKALFKENKDLLDGNEDACLDKLFGQSDKPSDDLLDRDEDACLDKLFEQENSKDNTQISHIDIQKANNYKSDSDLSPEKYLDSLSPEIKDVIKENINKEKEYNENYKGSSCKPND